MGQAIFITGTGTDIGKSALSLAIMLWGRGRGLNSVYFKPVQCGSFPFGNPPIPHGDAEWIAALGGEDLDTHVTYRFPSPVSPHLAAEKEGMVIEADSIRQDLDNLREEFDLVVMEGAGGAAVPLDRQGNSLGFLAAELEIPSLIACAPGLGTLHHTLSTLAYLGALEAPVAGFSFCHREAEAPEIFEDNRRTLEQLTGLPCFGAVPFSTSLAAGGPLSVADTAALSTCLAPAMESWWNATRG